MIEDTDIQSPTDSSTGLPASAGSAFVVKQFVECANCGKLWPYDGHAADVCCGGCSHNFYVPPCAMIRRLQDLERGIKLIESIYEDGDDTHDAWRAMGETAKSLIEQNDQSLATAGAGLPKPQTGNSPPLPALPCSASYLPMTTDIKPITAADLMDAAIYGKPIDPLRALAAYADPSNWVQCYGGEDSDGNKLKPCEWAFIGPTRPGYELAQHTLSRLNDKGMAPGSAVPDSQSTNPADR